MGYKYHPKPGHLWCNVCNKEKPDEEMAAAAFARSRGRRSGECKECKRGRYPHDPAYQRAWWLKKAYDLTVEQYQKLVDAQDGVCAICDQPPKKNRLHVDHDHSCCPGKVSCGKCIRGLLCTSCNSKLEWWLIYKDRIVNYGEVLHQREF